MDELPPSSTMLFGVALGLLAVQGCFVAAEVAFLATGTVRARRLADEGSTSGRMLGWLLADRGRLLSTVLIAITALGFTAESLVTLGADRVHEVYGHLICLAVVVAISVVFVEAMPVMVASKSPQRVASLLAPFAWLMHWVLWPIITLLSASANGILRLLGAIEKRSPTMTEDEVISLIEGSEVRDDEKSMLRRVLEFGDRTVEEVMVPRTDMICVPAEMSMSDAAGQMVEHGHSRLPVYRERRDNVVGILYSKDLLPHMSAGEPSRPVTEAMRDPLFIHEKRSVEDLVAEFQTRTRVMALVNDEYGGIAGLVTLEDALEELVGEIFDEHDVEERPAEEISETEFVIKGNQGIHEVTRDLGIELPEGDYETISGLVTTVLGHMAQPGEIVELEGGVRIEILEVERRRVQSVRLTRPPRGVANDAQLEGAR